VGDKTTLSLDIQMSKNQPTHHSQVKKTMTAARKQFSKI
jgi:hypothetical protein